MKNPVVPLVSLTKKKQINLYVLLKSKVVFLSLGLLLPYYLLLPLSGTVIWSVRFWPKADLFRTPAFLKGSRNNSLKKPSG